MSFFHTVGKLGVGKLGVGKMGVGNMGCRHNGREPLQDTKRVLEAVCDSLMADSFPYFHHVIILVKCFVHCSSYWMETTYFTAVTATRVSGATGRTGYAHLSRRLDVIILQ